MLSSSIKPQISWVADRIEHWPTSRLLPYVRNARRHSESQIAQIAASIVEFGFTNPILVGKDGIIIAGHGRLAAAQKLGMDTVPVVVIDHLTPTQRRALVLADNKIADNASWDEEMLKVELSSLQEEDYDLSLLGFGQDELDELLSADEPIIDAKCDEDTAPEVQEVPVSRLGDIWVCGRHMVLCGDATTADAYDQLFADGKKADMCFTDPPYNVRYASEINTHRSIKYRPILNDALGDKFYDFLRSALALLIKRTQGAIYIAMSSSEIDTVKKAFVDCGGHWSTFIIWVKNNYTMGYSDYQRQYEVILYGWPDGVKRYWCGDRGQSDVWNINRVNKCDLHPTMKPVELVERAMRNSSRVGSLVLDPFGGSGTTMIAAEKTGRIARLMELDPKYVDVIVRRWQDYSGGVAYRLADGVPFSQASKETQSCVVTHDGSQN